MYGSFENSTLETKWYGIASSAIPLGDVTIVQAELAGAREAIVWTLERLQADR